MKLRDFYEAIVKIGIERDPRGKEAVEQDLVRRKRRFEELKEKEKEYFDLESLTNPYADTRILFGDGNTKVKRILVGIDIEVPEILLADRLISKGEKIDLALSHHPEGKAYANFYEVMHMQADILNRYGIPINVAEALLSERIKEVERKVMPVNHTRAIDAAILLNIPIMCAHTPSDNSVANYLQKLFDETKPDTIDDVMNQLNSIPEYKEASRNNAGPKILIGSKERRSGKIFVDMTGGTEGSKEIFGSLAQAGIGTIVAMHLSDEHRKEAEKNHVNVVIAGHISSDNVGMNLLLDEISKIEPIEVLTCSGFKRFVRN
ncbi:MAG: NGG1p interacting factor NIF3 [Nitrospirota bacterium]